MVKWRELDGEEKQSPTLIKRTFYMLSLCQREHLGQRSSEFNDYPRPQSWLMVKLTAEPSLVWFFVPRLSVNGKLFNLATFLPKLCKQTLTIKSVFSKENRYSLAVGLPHIVPDP